MNNQIEENPYSAPKTTEWQLEVNSDDLIIPKLKKAHFWQHIFIPYFICNILIILIVLIAYRIEINDNNGFYFIISMIVFFVFFAINFIFHYLYLYRAWKIIQCSQFVNINPVLVVFLCFIPLFQIVWFFKALGDWSRKYKLFCTEYQLNNAPNVWVFLFFIYPILWTIYRTPIAMDYIWQYSIIFGFLFCFLFLTVEMIMDYQICRVINHFYYLQSKK